MYLTRAGEELTRSLWDWKARRKINKFSNQNVAGSCISSLHFINQLSTSLLLTASSESPHVHVDNGAN